MRLDEGKARGALTPVAIATDLDGTIILGGKGPSRNLVKELLRVKRMGVRTILVTGRCLSKAIEIVGRELFDAVVAENGAVIEIGRTKQVLMPPGWTKIRGKLLTSLDSGCEQVIISAGVEKLDFVRGIVPPGANIILNKDRLMILPRGVDKGTGIRAVLARMGLSPERTVCLGDGENDLPLFDSVGIRVALDNSVESLKEKADFVTASGDGEGTIEAIRRFFPKDSQMARERTAR